MDTDDIKVILGLAFLFFGAIFVVTMSASSFTTSPATVHVTDKAAAHGTNGIYLIFSDNETFIVEDNWFHLEWASSDRWRVMEMNGTYQCTATGMRFPPLSWYRNLIECTKV
jgi:hypothetical protein